MRGGSAYPQLRVVEYRRGVGYGDVIFGSCMMMQSRSLELLFNRNFTTKIERSRPAVLKSDIARVRSSTSLASTMNKQSFQPLCLALILSFLACLYSTPSCAHAVHRREEEAGGPDHPMIFKPCEPEPLFESDGGRILRWRDPMMTHMGLMEARTVTVNPQSLLLPQYANSHSLLVVTSGCARMGMALPMGMKANVRQVCRGELVAVPRGMPMWMYNDGQEPCSFLTFANIADPMMHGRRMYEAFHLAGAKTKHEMASIMGGFSKDMLMAAMDVDEKCVEKVMGGQKDIAIVKVPSKHRGREREREEGRDEEQGGGGALMADFAFNLEEAHRDIVHPKAGQLTMANSYKLPVLKLMGMAAGCMRLKSKALMAPGWFANADHMIYCVRGSARVQMVWPNGTMACDEMMEEGSMMMVPKNYPVMKQAGEDGFDAVAVFNNHRPVPMHMIGKDSVFMMIPREVRMASFEMDPEMDRQVFEESSRRHTTILLPPTREPRGRGDSGSNGEDGDASSLNLFNEVREALWSMFDDNPSKDHIRQVIE